MGLSRWLGGKEFACQYRRFKRCRFNSEWGRSPRGGRGKSLQNSCLEKIPMDTGAWWVIIHWVTKSQTQPATHTHVPNTYMLMK